MTRLERLGMDQGLLVEKEYLDVNGLAAYTDISASTWNKRRLTGDTPPFIRIGRSIRYHVP
jgi:hypothetical protein